jgi:hypothetical protein
MARLLSIALLSLSAVLASAAGPTAATSSSSTGTGTGTGTSRMPFCISSRGGSDEAAVMASNSASAIPSGGASSYSNQLEAVKASVLEAAAESVRQRMDWAV